MNKIIHLPDETWNKVSYWEITPTPMSLLDRQSITLNHDESNVYMLYSETLLNTKGLNCLEFHIFINLYREDNGIQQVFMINELICIGNPANLDTELPEMELYESAPPEYFDQPKVLEAILNLEKKGLITIARKKPNI